MKAIKNFRENWLILVAVAILAVASGLVSAGIINRAERIREGASIEYVDQENIEQDVANCLTNTRQDVNIKSLQEKKAEKEMVNIMVDDIKEIRKQNFEILKILTKKE